jgi:hypothetical protein
MAPSPWREEVGLHDASTEKARPALIINHHHHSTMANDADFDVRDEDELEKSRHCMVCSEPCAACAAEEPGQVPFPL